MLDVAIASGADVIDVLYLVKASHHSALHGVSRGTPVFAHALTEVSPDWMPTTLSLGQDRARTMYLSDEHTIAQFTRNDEGEPSYVWSHTFAESIVARPAVSATYEHPGAGDGVYVALRGPSGGVLAALSSVDGKERWRMDGSGAAMGAPALDADGTALFVSAPAQGGEGALRAVSPNGQLRWILTGPSPESLDVGTLQIARDGTVIAYRADSAWAVRPDGTVRWRMKLPPRMGLNGVLLDRDGVLFAVARDQWDYETTHENGHAPTIRVQGEATFAFVVETAMREGRPPLWAANYRPGLGGTLGTGNLMSPAAVLESLGAQDRASHERYRQREARKEQLAKEEFARVEAERDRPRLEACIPTEAPKARAWCEESRALLVGVERCVFGRRDCLALAAGRDDDSALCENAARECLVEEGVEADAFEQAVAHCQRERGAAACAR